MLGRGTTLARNAPTSKIHARTKMPKPLHEQEDAKRMERDASRNKESPCFLEEEAHVTGASPRFNRVENIIRVC